MEATTASTRRRILERAAALFVTRGVDATPLREIAEGVDLTKAALYYHFPSKEHLLVALVVPLHDDLGAVLVRAEDGEITAPGDLLAALLDANLANTDALRLSRDPAVRATDRLQARAETIHQRAVNCLVGDHPSVDEHLRAAATIAVLDELATRYPDEQHALVRRVGPTVATRTLGIEHVG